MLRKSKILLMLVVVLIYSLTGCAKEEENGKAAVRIAYFPNITHTQALVLKNNKTLEKKWAGKCDVSWKSFNAGPAETEALFAGEIDLGYIGPVPAVSANVKSKGDVKIISNATNAGAVLLARKNSNIKSAADLDGKKVAVPQLGNTQHLCLLNLLKENGLNTVDKGGTVTVNASSNADIVNLIDNGDVDAACVPEPWGTTIEKKGNANVVLDYDKLFLEGDYPVAVVVASKDFMDKHPDLVKDFLEEHKNASLYINENKDKSIKSVNEEIEKATGKTIADDVIAKAFDRIKVDTQINKEAIIKFAAISKNEGFIMEDVEEKNVFAAEFVK